MCLLWGAGWCVSYRCVRDMEWVLQRRVVCDEIEGCDDGGMWWRRGVMSVMAGCLAAMCHSSGGGSMVVYIFDIDSEFPCTQFYSSNCILVTFRSCQFRGTFQSQFRNGLIPPEYVTPGMAMLAGPLPFLIPLDSTRFRWNDWNPAEICGAW